MSKIKYMNVCTLRVWKDKLGQEHKQLLVAGIFKETESGGKYLRMHANPDVQYYILEQKNSDELSSGNQKSPLQRNTLDADE